MIYPFVKVNMMVFKPYVLTPRLMKNRANMRQCFHITAVILRQRLHTTEEEEEDSASVYGTRVYGPVQFIPVVVTPQWLKFLRRKRVERV